MDSYSGLGDDLKGSISIHSVRGEAAPVQRKNPVDIQLFPQDSQGGVGEIHWDVSVLFHENRDPLKTFRRRRHHLKCAPENKFKASFLRVPARSYQVKRFGQYRFRGDNGAGPFFQCDYAVWVQLLVSVHQRDEGSGIQQEFSGHGATAGSNTPGAADPSQAGHWRRCR